jgi:hypothetical protein
LPSRTAARVRSAPVSACPMRSASAVRVNRLISELPDMAWKRLGSGDGVRCVVDPSDIAHGVVVVAVQGERGQVLGPRHR